MERYFELREKIIRHMSEMPYHDSWGRIYTYGEFFPIEFSPFGYNETITNDHFPLAKEEAGKLGFLWREIKAKEYTITKTSQDLPDHIDDVSDSIVNEIIECGLCKKPYRIIVSELNFLRQSGIPLPRLCWECRFLRRLRLGNPPKFYHRKCQCFGFSSENGVYANQTSHFHSEDHCPNEFITAFPPHDQSIVYCEQCYNAEVV